MRNMLWTTANDSIMLFYYVILLDYAKSMGIYQFIKNI